LFPICHTPILPTYHTRIFNRWTLREHAEATAAAAAAASAEGAAAARTAAYESQLKREVDAMVGEVLPTMETNAAQVFYFSTHPLISPICRTPLFPHLTVYS